MSLSSFPILGTPVTAVSYDSLAEHILAMAREHRKHVVDFANTHVITLRRSDPNFADLAQVDLVVPDGMPLVWVMNAEGAGLKDRVYGPTFTRRFLEKCPSGFTHFLIGGSEECGDSFIARLTAKNSSLHFVGRYHGPCSAEGLLGTENAAVLRHLKEKKPDFIWVGLGTPKQYAWIHRVVSQVDTGIFLAVGFAFDAIAGTKSDAPSWMQKRGLTWLYRMVTEPRRLIPRYVKYNTLFICYLLIEKCVQRAKTPKS